MLSEPTYDECRALDASVAALMEPKPAPISADEARVRAWGADRSRWVWYSVAGYDSPHGWWTAEVGTDHGNDDHAAVSWRPARKPSSEMGDAWLVVEWARAHFSRWGAFAEWLKHEVSRGLTDGQTVQDAWVWRLVQPEHICRAALAMRPRLATPAPDATEARS